MKNVFLFETLDDEYYFFSNTIDWKFVVKNFAQSDPIVINDIFIEHGSGYDYKCFDKESFSEITNLIDLQNSIFDKGIDSFVFKLMIEVNSNLEIQVYDNSEIHLLFKKNSWSINLIYSFIEGLIVESMNKSSLDSKRIIEIITKFDGEFCEFDDKLNLLRKSSEQLF